jgi:hypothetical protein
MQKATLCVSTEYGGYSLTWLNVISVKSEFGKDSFNDCRANQHARCRQISCLSKIRFESQNPWKTLVNGSLRCQNRLVERTAIHLLEPAIFLAATNSPGSTEETPETMRGRRYQQYIRTSSTTGSPRRRAENKSSKFYAWHFRVFRFFVALDCSVRFLATNGSTQLATVPRCDSSIAHSLLNNLSESISPARFTRHRYPKQQNSVRLNAINPHLRRHQGSGKFD